MICLRVNHNNSLCVVIREAYGNWPSSRKIIEHFDLIRLFVGLT